MKELTIKAVWKQRYGAIPALLLAYLLQAEPEDGEWFFAPVSGMHREWYVAATEQQRARELLVQDGTINVREKAREGTAIVGYQYRINHDRIAEIERA